MRLWMGMNFKPLSQWHELNLAHAALFLRLQLRQLHRHEDVVLWCCLQ